MAASPNKRVLIVDNDPEESRTIGVMLERAGYDSRTTWSGFEALELLKSGEYEILLVSNYLPDLYVGDFFKRLSHLPVQPWSIVMHEGCLPATTHLGMKSIVSEENTSKSCGGSLDFKSWNSSGFKTSLTGTE